MTEREYNEAEGVRRSDLWRMNESPEKYRWFLDHPPEPTPALIFGTAAHKMMLEPDGFYDEFAVAPNVDRRTNAGKEEWARFLESAWEKTILTADDLETIDGMRNKALTVPLVKKLLECEHEIPLFWTDEDTGKKCKVRLDALNEIDGAPTVVDYKTANNAKTEIFNGDIFRYGYHLQAFMYTEAVMKAKGLSDRPDFMFIVQEKKPPYSVNVIQVTEDVMLAGMDCFRELMGRLKQCEETGYWYGYTGLYGEANEAFLPGYYSIGKEDDE